MNHTNSAKYAKPTMRIFAATIFVFLYSFQSSTAETNISNTTSKEQSLDANTHESLGQLAEKTKKIIQEQGFETNYYVECGTSKEALGTFVVCMMYFPETHNMKLFHKMQGFVNDIAFGLSSRDSSPNFTIYGVMKGNGDSEAAKAVRESKVNGNYTPISAFTYSAEFDQLYPIW